jgi:hypothetical protein
MARESKIRKKKYSILHVEIHLYEFRVLQNCSARLLFLLLLADTRGSAVDTATRHRPISTLESWHHIEAWAAEILLFYSAAFSRSSILEYNRWNTVQFCAEEQFRIEPCPKASIGRKLPSVQLAAASQAQQPC